MKFARLSGRAWLFRISAAALAVASIQMIATRLQTLDHQANALGPRVTILVAAHDLELGATLGERDVRSVIRHASQVPRHTIRSMTAARGAVVRVAVLADTPIQSGNLVAPGTQHQSVVPRGFRALLVADHSGLRPGPGTPVDLIASFNDPARASDPLTPNGDTAQPTTSQVIARGAIVLSMPVGARDRTANNARSNSSPQGVLIRVKESEVTAITFAQAFGVVSIALAPLEDACCT